MSGEDGEDWTMGSGISFSGWMFLIRTDSGAGGDGVEEEEENVVVVVVVVVAVATDGGSTSIAVDSSGLAMSASISSYASISAMEVSSYEASMAASRSQGSSMILNFVCQGLAGSLFKTKKAPTVRSERSINLSCAWYWYWYAS